jgi:hypothetical protein
MEEARQAKGLQKQWERGGIFNRSLPSQLTQTPQQIQANMQAEIERREQQRRFVEDMRSKNREGFHGRVLLNEEALHQADTEPDIPERFEKISGRR